MPSEKENDALKGTSEERVAFNLDESAKEADHVDDAFPEGGTDGEAKVKFINGNTANSAVVDVDGQTHVVLGSGKPEFVGLSKSELMAFEKDPYWVKVRWVLLVLFWLTWIGMLVAAIAIIVLAPKCPPRKDLKWWQESTIYQVYPRSFKDSDKDGYGDLKGLLDKLSYIKDDVKCKAIYLNPIYPSGGADTGYDITNHTAIDELFGDMDSFRHLVRSMHKKDMKLIMDFVPNHTSNKHPWFEMSRNKIEPYTDYYVWQADNCTRNSTPNNWVSVFGGPAWTYDEVRGECYLHQFASRQPDLNVRNPAVREKLKQIMLFWLENGVDGFRVDAVSHLFETENLSLDEPENPGGTDYGSLHHVYTQFLPETYEIMTEWREMIDNLGKEDGRDRLLMVEAYAHTPNQTLQMFNYGGKPGAHMPTNMALVGLWKGCDAKCVQNTVNSFMDSIAGADVWPNWQTGNHDVPRVASRFEGQELVNAVQMILMTLPGTAVSYYGEEIGMHGVPINETQRQDKAGHRDPQRTPMQWSGEAFAGFTSGNSTWLPVADDYKSRNVKAQFAHGAGVTNLKVYQELVAARQSPSFQWGDFHSGVSEGVYFYVRQAKGFKGFLVAVNFGEAVTINFPSVAPKSNIIPSLGKVVASTRNVEGANRAADFKVGTEVTLDNIHIGKYEGFIFEWPPEAVGQQM